MSASSSKLTVEEAMHLHPDEWLVFSNFSLDGERLVDGVLSFHSRDQEQAFQAAEDIQGSVAIRYAGELRCRNLPFEPGLAVGARAQSWTE